MVSLSISLYYILRDPAHDVHIHVSNSPSCRNHSVHVVVVVDDKMPPFSEDGYDGSAISALLALSSKLRNHEREMRRNRKVRFAPEHNIQWIVETVPTEYRPLYWISKKEFEDIKKDCADTVARYKLDNTVHTRGLESSVMTGENFLQCYLHRRGALRVVLKEQMFQKETGYHDPDDIADAYALFSKKSMEKARANADLDEQAIRL